MSNLKRIKFFKNTFFNFTKSHFFSDNLPQNILRPASKNAIFKCKHPP